MPQALESRIPRVGAIVLTNSGRKFKGFDEVVNGMHLFGIYPQIEIDGARLADDEMEALAIREGFTGLHHMSGFWNLNETFQGHIILWSCLYLSLGHDPGLVRMQQPTEWALAR